MNAKQTIQIKPAHPVQVFTVFPATGWERVRLGAFLGFGLTFGAIVALGFFGLVVVIKDMIMRGLAE
jgi:hypothetical protein